MGKRASMNYYNENDKYAAAWLRELIADDLIADGLVDERNVQDVKPSDLDGFKQCHFFAGIGLWSYALRMAGWPDDEPVWTGSCPCQPFSSAGKQQGTGDDRHVWPAFRWLIAQRKPAIVFGEQVASKLAREAWLAPVLDDLEILGYKSAVAGLPACSVGAPHQRQRLWFVALANGDSARLERYAGNENQGDKPKWDNAHAAGSVAAGSNAHWEGSIWHVCRDGKRRMLPGVEVKPSVQHVADDGRPNGDAGMDGSRSPGDGSGQAAWPTPRSADERAATKPSATISKRVAEGTTNLAEVVIEQLHEKQNDIAAWHTPLANESTETSGQHAKRNADRSESATGGLNEQSRLTYWPTPQATGRGVHPPHTMRNGRHVSGKTGADFAMTPQDAAQLALPTQQADPELFPRVPGAPGRTQLLKCIGNAIVAPVASEFIIASLQAINDERKTNEKD